jgi:poly-gamma-glutamate capsule biosynthesis protein CapA/YwtB (metallophosphatase superfamily)
MTLFPAPRQIERARRLLQRWDMIVGHHPHCPQPIAEVNGRLAAYSLGNFARGDSGERGWHGAALRVTIGPDPAGLWRAGESNWTFIAQTPQSDGSLLIDTAATCRFFPDVVTEGAA